MNRNGIFTSANWKREEIDSSQISSMKTMSRKLLFHVREKVSHR